MKVYTRSGMWLKEVEANNVVIGMSPKGQDDIGEVAFIEFLEDEAIAVDEPFIAIEGSKAVSEIPAPISGQIIEKNLHLLDEPESLSHPGDQNSWIVKVRVDAFDSDDYLQEDLPIEN
ncbi:glycine cleavage system protein H [Aerococcaceae bacterium DSM 111020]|nr:glycine cleavage system protein H [Aerococcaceae bacterium DSM 111020]